MSHPTVEQIDLVINNLKKIENAANGRGMLDMKQYRVHCGSPACVAGWYIIANPENQEPDMDFCTGSKLMAEHLGFSSSDALEIWAALNPDIWGNPDGNSMFASARAYNGLIDEGRTPFDCKITNRYPMTCIIEHWEAVKLRIAALNQ